MDTADVNTRTEVVTGPLRDALAARWPLLAVQLDTAAARQRPGEPVGIRWTDGPTVTAVRAALAPRFADDGSTGGYPVRLSRFYSPTAFAAALLTLHGASELAPLLAAGDRAAFWVAVTGHLDALDLPGGYDRQVWRRARLLAQLAGTSAGGDAYTWARWLEQAGWERLNPALDAVFGEPTACCPGAAGGTDRLQAR